MKEKEYAGERDLARLQIKTLEDKIKEQTAHIDDHARQLKEAATNVQAIAMQAIEGASGRNALAAVNKIALEQAKSPRQP